MAKIVDEIFSDWQELSPLLLKTLRKNNKDDGYPFFKNKRDLSLFMLKSILSLFSLEQQQEIQQAIKGSLLILKKIDIKTHNTIVIDEDDFLLIKNYLEQLENILKSGNENVLFLVETNHNIAQFISEKQEEINHKAGLVLDEKLPRFLSSSFEKEVKGLKKQVRNKEYIFFSAIIALCLALVCNFEKGYLYYVSILFPAIWLLWFLTKNINEDKKLLHEYKHKAVLARTYSLYSEQLEKYSDKLFYDDGERRAYRDLSYSFLEENIKSLTHNPAKIFNKEDKSLPYVDILNQLIKSLSVKKWLLRE